MIITVCPDRSCDVFLCVDRASCGVRGVDVFKALTFIKLSKQDNR